MNHVLPASGTSPIPMKPGTKVASDEPMRTSHAHASERPAPATGPVDRRDHRLLERADRADVRVVRLLERFANAAGKRLELAQVLARAEAAARARQDDCADRRIGRVARAPPQVPRASRG